MNIRDVAKADIFESDGRANGKKKTNRNVIWITNATGKSTLR